MADTFKREDVIFLVQHLELAPVDEDFRIMQMYYPNLQIPSKTQFFIEELLEDPQTVEVRS